MDEVVRVLLEQLGPSGAFLIAMAAYLIKKELSFQRERKEFIDRLWMVLEKTNKVDDELIREIKDLKSQSKAPAAPSKKTWFR